MAGVAARSDRGLQEAVGCIYSLRGRQGWEKEAMGAGGLRLGVWFLGECMAWVVSFYLKHSVKFS